jgi:hypothetical protein
MAALGKILEVNDTYFDTHSPIFELLTLSIPLDICSGFKI